MPSVLPSHSEFLPSPSALKKLGDFQFRKVAGRYLITNEWGRYVILEPQQFSDFIHGLLPKNGPIRKKLSEEGFIKGEENREALVAGFRGIKNHLWSGPSLHILVVTLRCNLKCVYCHSSVVGQDKTEFDMSLETAKKCVDFIFSGAAKEFTIEFQGGEPLMNWPVIRFVVEYVKEKNLKGEKKASIVLISNLSLMDDEKLDFLIANKVGLCTSLDGPHQIHEANRIHLGGNSHASVTRWMEAFRKKTGRSLGALMTTTKRSLSRPKEIVDEYRRLGLRDIFLRPLHYLGFAKRSWQAIGYSDEEYIAFYRQCMDYILEINRQGEFFQDYSSHLILTKILKRFDSGYVDLRSPCGAGLGQVSYNYNGEIYTCDEGRMVAAEGDKIFKIGHVSESSYPSIIEHATTRACCSASNMEGQPLCFSCAYRPYCGICPVLNYATQNTIWGRMPTNSYCYIFMHIFDYLFEKLADPKNEEIFKKWLNPPQKPVISPSCTGQLMGK